VVRTSRFARTESACGGTLPEHITEVPTRAPCTARLEVAVLEPVLWFERRSWKFSSANYGSEVSGRPALELTQRPAYGGTPRPGSRPAFPIGAPTCLRRPE
jgi:hypothetical protein